MRFSEITSAQTRPPNAAAAKRSPIASPSIAADVDDDPRNNGFVPALRDARRAQRIRPSRRGFLWGTLATASAATATSFASLFGPAREVAAQTGVIGAYPRRILTFCPPYNTNDNCQPGCGSSPVCTDCCTSDGYFRNEPGNGYTLYSGNCGDGNRADGWLWRFTGACGSCSTIEYRCSDGYVQTDTGPAPFICRAVTDCVPLAEGQAPGEELPEASRSTNWRPAGSLDVATDNGGSVTLNGWIADSTGVPVNMRVTVDGQIIFFGKASQPRPDIASTVRGAGPNTGFSLTFPLDPGRYKLCVDALSGALSVTVGCVNMNVGSGGSVRGPGRTGSITSPPVRDEEPAPTSEPGPTPTVTPTPAPTVPVVLPPVSAPSAEPTYGAAQVIRRSGARQGFVSGWAGDVDTGAAAFIEVTVDAEAVATARTDLPRPDVAAAFPALGPDTGFAVSFELPTEQSVVCVSAVGADDGRRRPLGCRTLGEAIEESLGDPDAMPTSSGTRRSANGIIYAGVEDVASANGLVTVTGWAFDPNAPGAEVEITIEVGGKSTTVVANAAHAESAAMFGIGASHGFAASLEVPDGSYNVIVSASNPDGDSIVVHEHTLSVG